MKKLRVVQWNTGKVGKLALRGILDNPDLELAGVFAHSPEKAGQDAGALCGRPDTGIKATNDIGRAHHRGWIEEAFAPWLTGLPREARQRRVDALVAATDLYLWKLVRRDMARPARQVEAVMMDLIRGVIGGDINIEAEAKRRD